MTKIVLTAGAKNDLAEIKQYISETLDNSAAAVRIVAGITKKLHGLERFPEMGALLKAEENIVGYRYLICGNYMVFYHISDSSVFVDRVLYGRRNYLSLLLGGEQDD